MSKQSSSETPLMKQYNSIKAKHPGVIILFRVGDFYETFGEDAVKASQILNITLTKRANGSASEVELAGFPYHALDTYMPKLVRAGQRVAICDQLEDPKYAKGIVKRGITEIITPGVTFNDKILEHQNNNYLASIFFPKNENIGCSFIDVSTGDFFYFSGDMAAVEKLFYAIQPKEVIVSRKDLNTFKAKFNDDFYSYRLEDWAFEIHYATEKINQHFKTSNVKGFGLEEDKPSCIAAGVLLHYLNENEQKNLAHIRRLYRFLENNFVALDRFTLRNLELLSPLHPDGKSFFQTINYTLTAMGARMLKKWIIFPLVHPEKINKRLNQVTVFFENSAILNAIETPLKSVGDVERLTAKLATRRVNPRECLSLKIALEACTVIFDQLTEQFHEAFGDISEKVFDAKIQSYTFKPLLEILQTQLNIDCPANLNNGTVFQSGIDDDLDELKELKTEAESFLEKIRKREIERTGISSLKINYNKVFGYYIEISNTNRNKVPSDYVRKQTLANAERYITPELKDFEEKILTAEEKILHIENRLYVDLLNKLQEFIPILQICSNLIAGIDVLQGQARLAKKHRYSRPIIHDEDYIEIVDGRHPVIETILPRDSPYIPNDVKLNNSNTQIMIITGPNMAGKSAVLRQTALITLMAHMGTYVPATSAKISLVDKIFTRVGASDNLSAGESTFMVEMNETARILNHATDKSLILLDEIGRGTSTYDGLSIAWALVEHLHNSSGQKAKTMFATHYHELSDLSTQLVGVKNFNVSVRELEGKILFMRKLIPGVSEKSFGIHVAEMAGMPPSVVARANELLVYFEESKNLKKSSPQARRQQEPLYQLQLFGFEDSIGSTLRKILEKININSLTPVEAMMKIIELKQVIEKDASTSQANNN